MKEEYDEFIGYGHLTNIIKFEQVYMITHMEGRGTNDSVIRPIRTFFTKNCEFIARIDPMK